jgi:hypothetical protein
MRWIDERELSVDRDLAGDGHGLTVGSIATFSWRHCWVYTLQDFR